MRYSFGGIDFNTETYELRAGDRLIDVEPQVVEVLAYLVTHRDRMVPKEELLDQVWRSRFVSESALTTRIKQARQAVGDDGHTQRVIKTVHGRGYRFIAPVTSAVAKAATQPDSAGPVARAPALSNEDLDLAPVPETRYVTNDGAAIAYQVFGTGPDLVLIGGFVSNVEVQWEHPAIARFLRRLGEFCRVIVFDKRGTGVSERLGASEAPSLEQRADDVRAVMEAVGISRATILGSSEGGSLSVVFTASHPERVERLVLHGTWARHPWLDQPDRHEFAWVQRRWGTGQVVAGLADSMAATAAGRRFFGRFERQSATPGTARRLVELMSQIDITPILPNIRVPVLVIHRIDDRMYGIEHARELAAGIPSARLVELPGTDHYLYSGDTEPILAAVRSFVVGTDAPPISSDRYVTTVLVAEITGVNPQLASALAPAIRPCVERNHGTVHELTSSALLSTYDGPGRAVRAAVEIRAALAPLGAEIRAGVHTAEVQLRGDVVTGAGADLAARLAHAAEPGSILVSRTVTDLIAGCGLTFAPYGGRQDGLPQPLYEALT